MVGVDLLLSYQGIPLVLATAQVVQMYSWHPSRRRCVSLLHLSCFSATVVASCLLVCLLWLSLVFSDYAQEVVASPSLTRSLQVCPRLAVLLRGRALEVVEADSPQHSLWASSVVILVHQYHAQDPCQYSLVYVCLRPDDV